MSPKSTRARLSISRKSNISTNHPTALFSTKQDFTSIDSTLPTDHAAPAVVDRHVAAAVAAPALSSAHSNNLLVHSDTRPVRNDCSPCAGLAEVREEVEAGHSPAASLVAAYHSTAAVAVAVAAEMVVDPKADVAAAGVAPAVRRKIAGAPVERRDCIDFEQRDCMSTIVRIVAGAADIADSFPDVEGLDRSRWRNRRRTAVVTYTLVGRVLW